MNFDDTPEEAAFRAEARAWLAANAPAFVIKDGEVLSDAEEVSRGRAWQARLAEGGYAGILLPKSLGGRGGATMEAVVFGEDCCAGGKSFLPIHELCLFKLGIHLGELWYLAELAHWLRANQRSAFLLTAPPLRLPGSVGSPLTPIATV